MWPSLVEVTRGMLIESQHFGALSVVTGDGAARLMLGDVTRPVFPRSAIKLLQAVPVIESGAADRYSLSDAELAIACGSHSGSPKHTTLVGTMLARVGLCEADLECGSHRPLGSSEAIRLAASGSPPTPLHNNCSGKHAGMLLTAKHLGEATKGYTSPNHPVQQRVRKVMDALSPVPMHDKNCGTDGCGIPNYAMPLNALAAAFSDLTALRLSGPHAAALQRLAEACWTEPEYVAGEGRLDTVLMSKFPGDVFCKTGAEGVYALVIRSCNLTAALKIEDGSRRAAETVIRAIVATLCEGAPNPLTAVKTWRGKTVGSIKPSAALQEALQILRTDVT